MRKPIKKSTSSQIPGKDIPGKVRMFHYWLMWQSECHGEMASTSVYSDQILKLRGLK